MINLEQLYRQVIMDNYKNPKNKGLVNDPNYTQEIKLLLEIKLTEKLYSFFNSFNKLICIRIIIIEIK